MDSNNDNDSHNSEGVDSTRSHLSSDEQGSKSSSSPSSHGGASKPSIREGGIAKAENEAVFKIRLMVMIFMTICTIGVACLVFFSTRQSETNAFEEEFEVFAAKVLESLSSRINDSMGAIDSFVVSIVSFARFTNMTFPFVTVPDFGARAAKVRSVTKAALMVQIPTVLIEEKDRWDTYSQEIAPTWIEKNLEVQGSDPNFRGLQVKEYNVSGIWGSAPGASVHQPMWQSYPTVPLFGYAPFNLDFAVFPTLAAAMPLLNSRHAVIGVVSNDPVTVPSYNSTNELVRYYTGDDYSFEEPLTELYYPIFDDSADKVVSSNQKNTDGNLEENSGRMVGAIGSWFYWRDMMTDILPQGTNGIMAVFENGCNQTFSYILNGPEAEFQGFYDAHDEKFDSLSMDSSLLNLKQSKTNYYTYTGLPVTDAICPYHVRVYPTKLFEEEFMSADPFVYMAVAVSIFLFTTAVFALYDYLVERRQQKVLSTAVKSSAIVSSLFPSNVQARLYGLDESPDEHAPHSASQKKRLQTFMNSKVADKDKTGGSLVDRSISMGRPIADLFPNATVLFGDIAGFTAWSSTREPSQVFILLESLYGMFDKLATKRGVFKVETVGDCYVAVAGLPDPRPDHAVVCTKFAHDCSVHMIELMSKLAITLGPDTEDLAMRFGLHSGPVTAGVLRGQKSRFQLFGDTVNTASRMESTGMIKRIQASEFTASELRRLHKDHWLETRKERIEVKGKGQMTTYWVNPKNDSSGDASEYRASKHETQDTTEDSSQSTTEVNEMNSSRDRVERLVDWNTDVLARLVKGIIAQRMATPRSSGSNRHRFWIPSNEISVGQSLVIEEVKEVIDFPEFEEGQSNHDPDSIHLAPSVQSQLRDLVSSIADTYNGSANAFHNFEHASHVCMSVSKLMSRILAADSFFDQEAESESLESFKHRRTFGISSDPLTLFACAFSALIHDVDHPGIPNAQLVKEGNALALRYCNRSVAEQHSVDVAWDLFMDDEYKELRSVICPSSNDLQRFRQLIVNIVMATDIMDKELKQVRNEKWQRAFDSSCDESTQMAMDRKATIVIEHLIQASDVAHTMQHWHVYRKWNERLFQEMVAAYKAGRAEKDPVGFWYEGELGFFDFYIIPLAKKLSECGVFGVSSDEYLSYATKNRDEWALKGEKIIEEMTQKMNL